MEGVGGPAAVSFGLGEPRNDVEEFDDRAGPPVHHQQWEGVYVRGARLDEVDQLAVDPSAEVRKLVESRFLRAPVVRIAPVLHQITNVLDWNAVLPAGVLHLIGEAGPRQAEAQVLQ